MIEDVFFIDVIYDEKSWLWGYLLRQHFKSSSCASLFQVNKNKDMVRSDTSVMTMVLTEDNEKHDLDIPMDWKLSKIACPDTCVICWEETVPEPVYVCDICKQFN